MNQSTALAGDLPRATSSRPLDLAKLFYTFAAALMLLLAFIGFSPYYLHGLAYPAREIPPPMKAIVTAHGMAMTAWLILLVAQPILIVRGNRRLHITLGKVGGLLALVVFGLGLGVAIRSATLTPPEARIWGLPPKQFMAVPFVSALLFAGFVGLGLIYRLKPAIHRPMMLLSTLAAVSAAVSRIDPLNALYLGTRWEQHFGPFFITLVIAVLLWIVRLVLTRSFDRWFTGGLIALIVANGFIMHLARTDAWTRFAEMLTG